MRFFEKLVVAYFLGHPVFIFYVSGQNVYFVCDIMDDKPLDIEVNEIRINFFNDMHNITVKHKLYMWCGKNELMSMA